MKQIAVITAFVGLALFGSTNSAGAETGAFPVYDQVCMNPAFVNAKHGIGMAAKNSRCATAMHPSGYGSGPDDTP